MKTLRWCAVAAFVCAAAATVWALGRDLSPGTQVKNPVVSPRGKAAQPIWPEGLADLANNRPYVHGYEINGGLYLFYTGDTTAFNGFVKRYASVEGITREVVLYVGPKRARSPWDSADRNIDANWGLYVPDIMSILDLRPGAPIPTHIDLWLGGHIDLAKLDIPEGVTVRSGGEIEKYVADRAKSAK